MKRVVDHDGVVAVDHEAARAGHALALQLVVPSELGVLVVLDHLQREEADQEDNETDGDDE
jgi:hypothetical protein